MFYATGTESSWAGLSSAISTFCVTTIGSYTQVYNNGLSMNGVDTNVLCLNHTATGMNYMWDSGPADYSVTSWGQWNGAAGEQFIALMPSTNSGSGTAFGGHTGTPFTTTPLPPGTMADGICASASQIPLASGVTYWFFGDKPTEDGEDYFHMVLETRTGVYSHFLTGRVTPSIEEVDYTTNYGSFVFSTGPTGISTSAETHDPASYFLYSRKGVDMLHYPEGTAVGQIDMSITPTSPLNIRETDWSYGPGLNQFGDSGINSALARSGPSGYTGRVYMAPTVAILTDRISFNSSSGEGYVVIGNYPGWWLVSLQSLEPEEVVSIGSNDYIVFPYLRKSTEDDDQAFPVNNAYANSGRTTLATGVASGFKAIAYRKS